MDDQKPPDVADPAQNWVAHAFRRPDWLGIPPPQHPEESPRAVVATLYPLLEMLLIIAGCEGIIMLTLPLLLPHLSTWQAAAADTTTLALTAGPILVWRLRCRHRTVAARCHLEIQQRTAELRELNTQLQNEVTERQRAQWFLNSVVEHLPIPVFIKEAKELRFIHWNQAGERLTGIPNAEMIGKNDHDFFPPDHAERNVAKDRAAFEKKGLLEIPEEIIQTRNHGARIVHVWKVPIFDTAAQPAFLLGICEDITDRKHAEAALAQSNSLLNAALESTADGLLVIDNHGHVTSCNQKFLELWQIPPALAARRDDKEWLQHVTNQLAEPAEFLAKVEALYHTLEASSHDELRFCDGRVFERYSQPQRLADQVVGRVWNFRDITARKQAEAALERSHELYRRAIIAANAIPYQKDYAADSYVFMGEGITDLLGYTPVELRSAVWKEIIQETIFLGPAAGMPAAEATRRVLAGELKSWQTDHRIRTRGGEIRWISDCSVPLRAADGKYVGSIGIIQDITERKRAEVELYQSEERFRLLVEESPDMIGIYQEGKLVFINSTGVRLWGAKTKEELLGWRSDQLIHPDDFANAMARLRRRLAGEMGLYPAEVRYLRRDGTIMPMEVSAGPITFGGKPAVQFIARDITESKLAQKRLTESERHLRLILESVPECIKLVGVDGTLLSMNSAGLAMIEADQLEQVVGLCVCDLVLPKYRPVFEALNAAVFRGESQTAEYEIVGLNGTHRWLETYAGPMRDGDGRIVAQLAVTRDISQRRQAEESLRLQEAALRSAANVVVITDPHGLIVWVNPAFTKVTGYAPAEVLGQNSRILQGRDRPAAYSVRFFANLWETISRGAVWQGEFYNRRKDGSLLIEDATITPVQNAQGEITHFVAVKQDITERKHAEAELAKAQKELVAASRLAGMAEVAIGVVHNVGNVLNSVNVAATCIADALRKSKATNLARIVTLLRAHEADLGEFLTHDPKGRQVPGYLAHLAEHIVGEHAAAQTELAELQQHIDHIKEIVRSQQSLAKVSGHSEIRDVTELVEDALRLNETSLARHHLKIIKEFENVPPIRVEKHKALQILVNLLQNAKQACQLMNRDDKQMTLRIRNGADRVHISVSDNGVGIPAENLTRIFNHGFTTKADGHGFGLHNSVNAAREMGGNLHVQSAGPGHGATFTLELPIHPV
ncbi:MAG: PAS domain S-box protein [Verrucomicrobia subdivision 3 bacterium]|nr:PAS domain S-box protein [Limisphaerales bacterium]